MYRSQLLLQQLGISQWIPKATDTVIQPTALLWRDQDELPIANIPSPNEKVASVLQNQLVKVPVGSIQNNVVQEKHLILPEVQQHESTLIADEVPHSVTEVIEASKLIAFNVHMLLHENFILFAEINSEHQQKLFNRIAQACYISEQRLLQWPLAIEFWDVNDDVVDAYLKGVFAQHRQKVCIVLGETTVPELKTYFKQQIICSNLEQLLESPQQKRALWQQLYPFVYDVENQNAQEGRDI